MEEEGVVANAARIGSDVLGPGLADLAARHELVGEVRGAGVFWAIELVCDRASREPVPAATMSQLKRALLARGLLPFVVDNRIHVVPPAVITPAQARHGLRLIDDALSALVDTR
jgi:taurine---2-oxoglutarate transaminase